MDPSPLPALSFRGPWSPATRQHRALRFLEAYTDMIKRCDLSGASGAWYAPTAAFINADGCVYTGGEAIWRWMRERVFAPFARIGEVEEARRVLLVQGGGRGLVEERGGMKAEDGVDLVLYEHVIVFGLNGEGEMREVRARRMMELVIGKGEGGEVFDEVQILQGKVWWDTAGLVKEIEARKEAKAKA